MKNKMVPCEHVRGERWREVITQNKSVTSNLKLPKIESVTSKQTEEVINSRIKENRLWSTLPATSRCRRRCRQDGASNEK